MSKKRPASSPKSEPAAEIVVQQKLAARKLHVSATALRLWEGDPTFPSQTDGYNLTAIRLWLAARGSQKSDAGGRMADAKLARQIAAAKLDLLKLKIAERLEEQEQGNILPRDELTITHIEIIGLARDRIMSDIPREISKRFPKQRRKIFEVCDEVIRGILEQLARDLQQIALTLTPPERTATDGEKNSDEDAREEIPAA